MCAILDTRKLTNLLTNKEHFMKKIDSISMINVGITLLAVMIGVTIFISLVPNVIDTSPSVMAAHTYREGTTLSGKKFFALSVVWSDSSKWSQILVDTASAYSVCGSYIGDDGIFEQLTIINIYDACSPVTVSLDVNGKKVSAKCDRVGHENKECRIVTDEEVSAALRFLYEARNTSLSKTTSHI